MFYKNREWSECEILAYLHNLEKGYNEKCAQLDRAGGADLSDLANLQDYITELQKTIEEQSEYTAILENTVNTQTEKLQQLTKNFEELDKDFDELQEYAFQQDHLLEQARIKIDRLKNALKKCIEEIPEKNCSSCIFSSCENTEAVQERCSRCVKGSGYVWIYARDIDKL